jgi:hypothetical protein
MAGGDVKGMKGRKGHPRSRLALVSAFLVVLAACAKDETSLECGPPDQLPDDLACTGLYADFDAKQIAPSARPYAPAVSFWSDGYDKSRWIELPDGQTIDATSMDGWKFPVGTKVWKEFRAGDRRIETRLLWKDEADHWAAAAYVWSEDGASAKRGEGASLTIGSAPYHVPTLGECGDCHTGSRDVLLGFEAISLAQPGASGLTLDALARENRLAPAPAKTTVTIDPGLAVLHVNCGVSCHDATAAARRHDSTLRLRISFDEAANEPVESWELYATTVNVPAKLPLWGGAPLVSPGAPDESALISAMTSTDATGKMPPTARTVDVDGVTKVEAFVRALAAK